MPSHTRRRSGGMKKPFDSDGNLLPEYQRRVKGGYKRRQRFSASRARAAHASAAASRAKAGGDIITDQFGDFYGKISAGRYNPLRPF